MPLYKYLGNVILSSSQNWLLGTRFTEFHSGYRAYNVAALREVPLESLSDTWHFDTEIILEMLRRERRILEAAIPTYYGDEICHVNGIPYAWNCLRTTARFALTSGRWPRVPASPRYGEQPAHPR